MMSPETPGQVVYEAWLALTCPDRLPQHPAWCYTALSPATRRAWEAVARAIVEGGDSTADDHA